jgi:thiamine biosynthesis lipoprotein ApbE
MADALSTGFCLMPLAACQEVADRLGIRAHFVLSDGTRLVLRSRPGAPRQQSRAPAVVSPATLR